MTFVIALQVAVALLVAFVASAVTRKVAIRKRDADALARIQTTREWSDLVQSNKNLKLENAELRERISAEQLRFESEQLRCQAIDENAKASIEALEKHNRMLISLVKAYKVYSRRERF